MSQLFISSKLLSPLMQRSNNTAIVFPKAILQSSQLLYLRQQFKKRLAQELQLKVVMHEVITTVEVLLIKHLLRRGQSSKGQLYHLDKNRFIIYP